MADGLLLDGDADFARDVYRVALRRTSLSDERQKIRTRLGLAAAPTSRTPMLMGVLQLIERNGFSDPFVSDGMATWLKTLPFSEDEKFQALAEKHAELLPIANWHWNLQTVLWAVQRNQDVIASPRRPRSVPPLRGSYGRVASRAFGVVGHSSAFPGVLCAPPCGLLSCAALPRGSGFAKIKIG